jgi:hypothetical protein
MLVFKKGDLQTDSPQASCEEILEKERNPVQTARRATTHYLNFFPATSCKPTNDLRLVAVAFSCGIHITITAAAATSKRLQLQVRSLMLVINFAVLLLVDLNEPVLLVALYYIEEFMD